MAFIKRSPVEKCEIDPDAIMNESYMKVIGDIPDEAGDTCNGLLFGVVYPEPGGTFTVHNVLNDKIRKGLKLEWASPLLSVCLRPELRQVEVVLDK